MQDLLRSANGDQMSVEDRQELTAMLQELRGRVTPEMLREFKRNRFQVAQHHVVRVTDDEDDNDQPKAS